MTLEEHDEPVACTLTGDEQISRRDRWLRLADLALVAKTATDSGVQLHFRSEPAVCAELTELAGLETECCGFASWKVIETGDTIMLDVRAGQAGAPAVWAMFDESPPAITASRL